MMYNQDTHSRKKRKSFAILTITEKKLPERFLVIDHNILMPKKAVFFKLQAPNSLPISFPGFSCRRHFPPFMNSLHHDSLNMSGGLWRQAATVLWEVVSSHMQNQCQWKSKRCWPPSPPATTCLYTPPNKPPFWPWSQALKHFHGTWYSALHSLELNHHNCYCSLIAR